MRRVLLWLAVLMWLPVYALAQPDMPYAPDTVVQAAELNDRALTLLDVLYPALRACEEQITLPDRTLYDDVNAAMQCLSRNYPELFHVRKNWSISYYQDHPEYATALKPSYTMPARDYSALSARLMEAARSIVNAAAGSQVDRAEALHDALCQRATYDHSESGEENNTAIGALLTGATQCEGYAQALALLYRLAGIPCGVITGEASDASGVSRHAWNVAVIDGQPTLIDATWNDQEDNGVTHWYYGVTSAMMAIDHLPDPELAVPACDSLAVNWHARRGLLVSDREGLLFAIRVFAQSGEVSIRFADTALFADFNARMNDWIGEYNAACAGDAAFYGSYGVILSEEQMCVRLHRIEGA